jgi:Prenyltransferase and squalene oxidase repeat
MRDHRLDLTGKPRLVLPFLAAIAIGALLVNWEPSPPALAAEEPTPFKIRDPNKIFDPKKGQDAAQVRAEAAIGAGLHWLLRHQADDGHWSLDRFADHGKCTCAGPGADNDVAATGSALLAFFGAGKSHRPIGKDAFYPKNIDKGLKYLLARQQKDGSFGGGTLGNVLAALAVCESYGLTADPQLKEPARRALDNILQSQQAAGGWADEKQKPEITTFVWHVTLLRTAKLSGLDVPDKPTLAASKFLDSLASADGARYGQSAPPKAGMETALLPTAAGLRCQALLRGPKDPGLLKGVDLLTKSPPTAKRTDMGYYFFATSIMYWLQGKNWDTWGPQVRDLLIEKQDKGEDGEHADQKGSWSPQGDPQGKMAGRLMITALALMTLEVYYTTQPLYRREP